MALKGELDGEYFKSLGPSQLLAERGREILVINPGSAFFRIGLASQKEPLLVPHCIARYGPELARKRKKVRGGISELEDMLQNRRRSSTEAGTSQEKGEACSHIEANFNIAPGWLQTASARATSSLKLLPEADDSGVRWTETQITASEPETKAEQQPIEKPLDNQLAVKQTGVMEATEGRANLADYVTTSHGESLPKAEALSRAQGQNEGAQVEKEDFILERRVTSRSPEGTTRLTSQEVQIKGDFSNQADASTQQTESQSSDQTRKRSLDDANDALGAPPREKMDYRRWICGEESLHIAHCEPYVLRRPIRRGRLNVSNSYPLQQVCTDLCTIWHWALSEKLNLSLQERRTMSAVLVLSETLQPREAKELVTIVLKDLQFESVIVHQESLAALFGNNMTSACIVSLGAQVCSVACIEEGSVLPSSKISLPFGGEDVSRALLWVQQHYVHAWPYGGCDPLADVQDRLLLEGLKEEHCFYGEGGHVAPAEFLVREKGASTEQYQTPLIGSPNLAPVGLFYPTLLAPEEYPPPDESALSEDYEELLDDAGLAEPGRRASESVGNGGDALSAFQQGDRGAAAPLMGVDEAVVQSILSTYSADLQKKLFSSIQLIGGGARMAGVVDFMEERVLQSIPGHIDVDTVEVVKNRADPRTIAWRGGCILGVLDYSEAWVQREDWVDGGARAGSGRKYKDTNNLSTQTFWYCSSAE